MHVDWEDIQRVERDICLLYHQLSEYTYVMGDLYWGSVYSLPYWNYLRLDLEAPRATFIRDGCLIMILAMAFDTLDGSGDYIRDKLALCTAKVDESCTADPNEKRLVEAVKLALRAVSDGRGSDVDLERESSWVHGHFVRGYFEERARVSAG